MKATGKGAIKALQGTVLVVGVGRGVGGGEDIRECSITEGSTDFEVKA